MSSFLPPEGYVESSLLSFFGVASRPRLARIRKRNGYWKKHFPAPFLDEPRTRRRDRAASLRWRIQSDPEGQGLFTSSILLPGMRGFPLRDEEGRPYPSAWARFSFMSRRPLREAIFFCAHAVTVAHEASEAIVDLTEKAVREMVAEADRPLGPPRQFCRRDSDGNTEVLRAPHSALPSLGGLTVPGAQAAWLRERWHQLETLVTVIPSARLDPGGTAGLGVRFIVDKESLTTETVPMVIRDFLERGEGAYEEAPVDLSLHREALQGMLAFHLWRWDVDQAKSESAEPPLPSENVRRWGAHQSQASRGEPWFFG